MAKHLWTVVCRKVVIDQSTNTASIFEVMEELGIFPVPSADQVDKVMLPIDFASVSLWARDDPSTGESQTQRIQVLGPSGRELASAEQSFDLDKFSRARNIANVPGLPYSGLGTYTVKVSVKTGKGYQTVAQIPFDLKEGPNPSKRN